MVMTTGIQLDLLQDNGTFSLLKREIELLRQQNDNVRKGLFARHNELAKLYLKQQEEIDRLKGVKFPEIIDLFSDLNGLDSESHEPAA